MTTAAALIAESTTTNSIAHAEWSEDLALDLSVESVDSAEDGSTLEYWGTTESGAEWRVHLTKAEA